jgi:hypothetical protein
MAASRPPMSTLLDRRAADIRRDLAVSEAQNRREQPDMRKRERR